MSCITFVKSLELVILRLKHDASSVQFQKDVTVRYSSCHYFFLEMHRHTVVMLLLLLLFLMLVVVLAVVAAVAVAAIFVVD